MRAALKEGEESGTPKPFDMEAFLADRGAPPPDRRDAASTRQPIAVTAAAFGTHISPLNWCGVGVTAVGFAAFAKSKRRGPPPRRRRTDAGLSPVEIGR